MGKSNATISFNCSECREYNNWNINTFDFEFKDAEIPELPVNITINNRKYSFSYLTLKNVIPLADNNVEKDTLAILASQCVNMDFSEAYTNLSSNEISFEDGILLEKISKMLYHGIKPMSFVCDKCKHDNVTLLDIKQMIVSPFRETESNSGDRITFGNEA